MNILNITTISSKGAYKESKGILDEFAINRYIAQLVNTSASITRTAAVTSRLKRVIGMQFINPVPIVKLVEVIYGYATTFSFELCRMSP